MIRIIRIDTGNMGYNALRLNTDEVIIAFLLMCVVNACTKAKQSSKQAYVIRTIIFFAIVQFQF